MDITIAVSNTYRNMRQVGAGLLGKLSIALAISVRAQELVSTWPWAKNLVTGQKSRSLGNPECDSGLLFNAQLLAIRNSALSCRSTE
jgi:hypothetical protein